MLQAAKMSMVHTAVPPSQLVTEGADILRGARTEVLRCDPEFEGALRARFQSTLLHSPPIPVDNA